MSATRIRIGRVPIDVISFEAALDAVLTDAIAEAMDGVDHLYVSVDIDCLDPAFAPGTGTPEPAGMSSNLVMSLLEGMATWPFVGMDCVEVAPAYDHAEITSYAAAQFVWTYLCGQIAKGA